MMWVGCPPAGTIAPRRASQACISAISRCCSTITASASCRVQGSLAHRDPRHVDGPLMMRDHLHPEVHIRVAGVRQVHIAHHALMRDLELLGRWGSDRLAEVLSWRGLEAPMGRCAWFPPCCAPASRSGMKLSAAASAMTSEARSVRVRAARRR
jgi:hypothetical protein